MRTMTEKLQKSLTPKNALEILMEGNRRFVENIKLQRDLKEQVAITKNGQYPFAAILSCIDSRVPIETIFDQGIGDVFSARVAGNIINEDILGSLEYSCKVAGSKLIIVLGHSKCGAVTAACNHVELGNITKLLSKIQPVVEKVIKPDMEVDSNLVEKVSHLNVSHSVDQILKESQILEGMEKNGEIQIVGAMYDVESGQVTILD